MAFRKLRSPKYMFPLAKHNGAQACLFKNAISVKDLTSRFEKWLPLSGPRRADLLSELRQ